MLHRIVRESLETFLAEGRERSASGEGYPYYVGKELRSYLACGDMSRGFARVRCSSCANELLLPDGVFVLGENETFKLVTLPPPEDEDILCLTKRVGRRVRALVERRYGTVDDGDGDVLEGAIGEAMRSIPTVSFDDASDDEVPEGDGPQVRRSRRCASVDGFSIHANTAVAADNRVGLEHLCRYGMRPPFSHERLSISSDGKVLLGLRRPCPRAGGVSTRYFEPVKFLRRLRPHRTLT